MKKLLLAIFSLISVISYSQTTGYLRYDTVRVQRGGGNSTLVIENATRTLTNGFLQNYAEGRTKFAYALDSVWIDGDSIRFRYGTTTLAVLLPIGEVTQSALDDTAAAIRADHWAVRGNAIAQDTSKFIGTTDSAAIALRIRVNNYNAGYLGYAYQTSNPPYTNDGNNYTGDVAFGWRALDSTRKRIDAGISGNGGSIAIGADALRDNTLTANVAIGNNAGKRGRTLHRNVIIGGGAFQFGYDGEFNVAVGQFAMEVQDGVDGNTGVGTYALRSNKMGGGHTAIGGFASSFGSAWVDAITVTNGGSGYTTATVTISAPDLATPGTSSVQATATATINSGAITAITLTNKGMGYSTAKNPVTVTITGDGTGATATATLRMAENNTSVGYVSSYFNTVGRRLTTVGAYSGYGLTSAFRTLVDDDMTLIGYNATRGDSRATSVPFINSTGVGSNVKVNCDSCFVLGPPEVSTTIGASTVNASAKLEITSTTKGFLPPRMSAAQRVAISSPATALFVWDSDSSRYMGYNGSTYKGIAWTDESGGGGGGGGTWGSITGTLSDQTDLQAALDLKAPLASPTFTGTITTPLTASRAVVTGASSELAASATTATELGYVSGVTSAIQTQLNAKISGSLTSGRIPYATGAATLADNANMVWDNTNSRIGLGRATPIETFDVLGAIRGSGSGNLTALQNSYGFDFASASLRVNVWGGNSSTRGAFQFRQLSSTGTMAQIPFTIDANGATKLGTAGSLLGVLKFDGSTSGTVTVQPPAVAGTPTLTFPTTSGTFALTSQLSLNTKNINLPSPSAAENEFIFFTPVAITVTNTRAVLVGSSTPSVTYNIGFGTDRTSLTNVYTAGQTVTSTTTGTDASGVNDATIPANSWVILTTSAQSGTVNAINASIQFTVD